MTDGFDLLSGHSARTFRPSVKRRFTNARQNVVMDFGPPHVVQNAIPSESLAALQVVSEPTRARIFALLGHGEHCVCDVGDAVGLSTALVSHHLRVLRATGLLSERRSGRWVLYSLDLEQLARARSDLVALLTPTDAAASICPSVDCGAKAPPPGVALGPVPRFVEPIR